LKVKDFDELLTEDREFSVAGEKFRWCDVRPEVLTAFEPSENGDQDDGAVWRLMDDQILLFLDTSERDRWKTLRARDERPVTIRQLTAILQWLMEEQTGRPTEQPSPSAVGRGQTAGSSKAK
jgi:hypothetical protein